MAVNYNSNVVTSGLVMGYDMTNTQKSWRGKPATNLLTYSEDFSNAAWNGNLFGNWINSSVTTNTTIAPDNTLTADTITGNYGKFTASIPASVNTAYTFSCWVKNVSLVNPLYFHVAFGLNGTLVNYNNIISIPVNSIGSWSRYSITVTSPASGINQIQCGIEFGASKMNGGTFAVAVWGAQLEVGSYATPYIPTTTASASRSTTQAILDITGNNTITATSLTYASNNTFSFADNASGNYIDCGNAATLQIAGAITIDAWVNPTTRSSLGNVVAKNGNTGYRFRLDSAAGALWWYVSGNSIMGGTTALNTWAHLVVSGDGSGLYAYINGVQVASNTTAYTPSAVTGGNLLIGCVSPGAETFNGTIAAVKIYNRRLSASEVSQNFYTLRGRYGI